VPVDLPQKWVDGFYSGLLALARHHNVALAGGDTAQSPAGVLADIMVVGSAPRGRAVLRSGAKPGDRIYVTGALGESAAEIRRRYAGKRTKTNQTRFQYPEPRLGMGKKLVGIASAMIDISDGLSTDLSHIAEESDVGALIFQSAIPVAASATMEDALHGGDDYELLFTSAKTVAKCIAGVPVTEIGEIVNRKGMWIQDERGRTTRLKAAGWEHFASR
jgi:thiamine-monophosphate kinase